MGDILRILNLEDREIDAELIREKLLENWSDCHIERVETKPDFIYVLAKGGIDLILADSPALDENGTVVTMVHTVNDITAQKKAAEEIKRFFSSGYPVDMISHLGIEREVNFIQKPFAPKIFLNKVRAVLDT
jgi:response regulator RpfG family c-di-GMP phosphodiesterase